MNAHLDPDELVRWRDHGTASDRNAVLVHLAACRSCAATYAELVRTSPVTEGPARFDPADFVDRGYAVRERVARRTSLQGSTRWLTTLFDTFWNPPVHLARAALATQVALILLLAVVVAVPRFREQSFTTLSGPQTAAAGIRLTVMFQPNVTEDAMRRALLEIDGSIVSGPSALGVYVVQLPARPDDDPAVQSVIDKLRTNVSVVRFVEREP